MIKNVKILLLTGGKIPKLGTPQSAGYDVYPRCIVSLSEMDKQSPYLRKNLFNFKSRSDNEQINKNIIQENGQLIYNLMPNQSVVLGIGFITEMPSEMFYYLLPRSGATTVKDTLLQNAMVPIDADFRGEATAKILNIGNKPFIISKEVAIAQVVFQKRLVPQFVEINNYNEFSQTERSFHGLGHTDFKNKNLRKNNENK
ncbi:hypothetical protein KKC17_02675 [Patescibacteria group bacterium]|nr:hypothetical protein [Patescibacteria group bacterium]